MCSGGGTRELRGQFTLAAQLEIDVMRASTSELQSVGIEAGLRSKRPV
jgi:hypothetical protein